MGHREVELKMEGIVQAVNNNGIKINDRWYNATKDCEKFITPDLKGCMVEITLLPESNMFNFIRKVSEKENLQKLELEMRFRAMAVSYAKDLVISDDIDKQDMIELADRIFNYIKYGDKK